MASPPDAKRIRKIRERLYELGGDIDLKEAHRFMGELSAALRYAVDALAKQVCTGPMPEGRGPRCGVCPPCWAKGMKGDRE